MSQTIALIREGSESRPCSGGIAARLAEGLTLQLGSMNVKDPQPFMSGLPPSTVSDADDGYLRSALGSVGEEMYAEPEEEGPELDVASIHAFIGSHRSLTPNGVPKPKFLRQVSGTGLAPWEIHRPQKFVRDLVSRRCFPSGSRLLDAGCGLGDNALYIAKACPEVAVIGVDVVSRCLEFAEAKAKIRNMRGKVSFEVGDLTEQDPRRPSAASIAPTNNATYDIVVDSSTYHNFSDPERERYAATLKRLLKPGGLVYMNCMSEEETRPGGPSGRISVACLTNVFNRSNGWELEAVEDSIIELHPTFWAGRGVARLYTIRKL
ncbi:hypothetical protein Agub_g10670 [Astrephomene gubernaculifera]|uniref:Methyltransferase domain-containing protein n=1 Tax=Astrephomene gubernaculifera TaxID=47775 RepID=A0AAD3DY27_9CHLO|nr:hypothetical protein Agub_g10670 [Astrephomene gubernaculifera]